MPLPNTRRTATEIYEPKQRITGGIVLFLIMLLIYSILKIVLGFSSAPENFRIAAPLDIERINIIEAPLTPIPSSNTIATPKQTPKQATTIIPSQPPQVEYRLPSKFVFLDLNTNPMQQEFYQEEEKPVEPKQEGEKKWYVQAATFKTEEQAENLVQQIKDKNIASEAEIVLSTNKNGTKWYIVRLPPQSDHGEAREQNKQLRRRLRIRGAIRKLN
jgi:cell division septation protein DedD